MLELLAISFTFTSLVKILLIIIINMIVGNLWYSPLGFQKQWMKAMKWSDCETCDSKVVMMALFMAHLGTLLSSIFLNLLLIAFNIRAIER
ncbi:unnamed protein product [Rotaria sp. Silwood1]|nr:unnamed protein product [Rotaria sp. Silwood1]